MSALHELLQRTTTVTEFADLVGLTHGRVSQLLSAGELQKDGTALDWLRSYVARLREEAAGRDNELARARTLLTESQRRAQDLKNAIAERQYAPVGLLADVLGIASAALAERLEGLPPRLRIACPDLPDAAFDILERAIASARVEWERSTLELIEQRLGDGDEGDERDG